MPVTKQLFPLAIPGKSHHRTTPTIPFPVLSRTTVPTPLSLHPRFRHSFNRARLLVTPARETPEITPARLERVRADDRGSSVGTRQKFDRTLDRWCLISQPPFSSSFHDSVSSVNEYPFRNCCTGSLISFPVCLAPFFFFWVCEWFRLGSNNCS